MGVALAVEADDAPIVFEFGDGVHDSWGFAEAKERGDVGEFDGADGAGHFNDASFGAIVDDGGGEDYRFVGGEGGIGTGDVTRQGVERRDDHFGEEGELGLLPGCDEVGPVGIGFDAGHSLTAKVSVGNIR